MILTKEKILKELKAGGRIRYGKIRYGIDLIDKEDNEVGTVRYDTFLKLYQYKTIVKSMTGFMYDYYE